MLYLKRALHLYLHYFSGPLLGFNQKLIIADNQNPLTAFRANSLALFLFFLILGSWSRSSPLAIALILSLFIYSFSPVIQIVLEYRAYLSSAGIALLLASAFRHYPMALIPILSFFAIQTLHRHRLYASPIHFWTQASHDCPSPAVIANLAIALQNPSLFRAMLNSLRSSSGIDSGLILADDGTIRHLELVTLPQIPLDPGDIVVSEELFREIDNGH